MFKGLHQPGRGEGGIDQQRHAGGVRNLTDRRQVQNVHAWVAHSFTKKQFGVGLDGRLPCFQITGFYKSGFNAEPTQGVVQ